MQNVLHSMSPFDESFDCVVKIPFLNRTKRLVRDISSFLLLGNPNSWNSIAIANNESSSNEDGNSDDMDLQMGELICLENQLMNVIENEFDELEYNQGFEIDEDEAMEEAFIYDEEQMNFDKEYDLSQL